MAVRLFSLRHVPEEESEGIRSLLNENRIEFYETGAGNWGISSPAIWLQDKADQERAKQLIDEFQQSWSQSQREHHARLRQEGKADRFFDRLQKNPLQVLVYLAIVLLVLYVSTKPFISLGN